MHILFYSNWYIKQTVQLANALAAEHQVTLIFPKVSPELNAFDGRVAGLQEFLEPGVELIALPYMQSFNLKGWIPVLQARRVIRKLKPDIVHFNESYDFRCLLLMMICPDSIFVTSVHDPIPHSGEKISLQRFKYWVRDQIRKMSHGLVVYGENLREVLANYSKIPVERIYAVPHGEYRYYNHFDQGRNGTDGNGYKNVLFFGRWEKYKGIDVLIDAEPLITARVPNARIVLAGEGRLPLSELQPRMVHPDNFIIKNYSIPDEEVPDLFKKADVVVLPYREATQSGPLHIAGVFSKPAVVTTVGALPEVVDHGATGLLIPPEDPPALAQAVCQLLESPEDARQMGRAARKAMLEKESSERVAQLHAEAYRHIIESRPKGVKMRHSKIRALPASTIRSLRLIRKLVHAVFEPLDYMSRVINHKEDFPPLYLRRYVGPLRSFEMSGSEFMVYLKLICKLQPHERVLDIGCGCGLIAMFLVDHLNSSATYVGADIHKPSIDWCQRHIHRRHPQFGFKHIDVKNVTFNPNGKVDAERYSFPLEDNCFDVIIIKSVFTHMRPAEVDNYLKNLRRLLSDGGRCLATFFLLNKAQEAHARKGLNQLHFAFGDENWRYVYKNSPESAAAYREDFIMTLLAKHGLELMQPTIYGAWSGQKDGVAFQDMMLIRKKEEA